MRHANTSPKENEKLLECKSCSPGTPVDLFPSSPASELEDCLQEAWRDEGVMPLEDLGIDSVSGNS